MNATLWKEALRGGEEAALLAFCDWLEENGEDARAAAARLLPAFRAQVLGVRSHDGREWEEFDLLPGSGRCRFALTCRNPDSYYHSAPEPAARALWGVARSGGPELAWWEASTGFAFAYRDRTVASFRRRPVA